MARAFLPILGPTLIAISGVVSAPLWDSEKGEFAGMLTVLDIIHLMQYYWRNTSTYDDAAEDVETFKLDQLRGAFESNLLHKC